VSDASLDAPFETISIFECIVGAKAMNRTSLYFDENRRIEIWLLETGEGEIDDELYREITEEIEGRQIVE